MSTNKNQIIRNCYPWEWISVDLKGLSLKGVMFHSGVDQFDESSLKQYWCIVLIWLRFAVSQEVLKHLRWHFASYAGRSSKQTPSFILNLVSFFTLHCFLSLSITLWYCMVISLVSPWCYLKPKNMHKLRSWILLLWIQATMDLVLEDHTMNLILEKLRMQFLGCKTLNNILGTSELDQFLISKYSFRSL